MNRNKYLLLLSSLGVLALLVWAAVEENLRKEWRQIQVSAHAATGPIDVRLRQIVVPALEVTDRCVSCHVGMAPGESALSGDPVLAAHKPVSHDPTEFGCTACHAGQGRATEKADAHGDVDFWPEPMIPVKYAYAGCGTCHAYLRVPNGAMLERGMVAVEQHDCFACHRIDGRGGTLRPGGTGGMEGPDLSNIGLSGHPEDWYAQHLARSEAAPSGVWKDAFGAIDEPSREAIEVFLASCVGAPDLIEAKALFHSLGCRGCHKINGIGGDDGLDLSRVGQKDPGHLDFSHVHGERTLANWFAKHFRSPSTVVPGSQMPTLGLSAGQIDQLTYYMLSLRVSDFPEAYWPKDRMRAERFGEREFATDGATLYGTFCAACHGAAGEGMRYPESPLFPSVANPDFLDIASDDFLIASIRRGRPGRRMPAWGEQEGGLRPEEIEEIVAHLRQLADAPQPPPDPKESRWARGDVAQGERLFTAYCTACHGPDGRGVDAPALNNTVLLSSASDSYLVETVSRGRRGTIMPGFREGSTVYRALTSDEIESLVTYIRTWEQK